jgi:hypothetical protein
VPGGDGDFATSRLPGGAIQASAAGSFEMDAPPVLPGQWIAALAIDTEGNTSEFGPSSRVGTGVAQCGNVSLAPGWNLTGYFGEATLALGNAFPPGSQDGISAIYRLVDGTNGYQAWFPNGGPGRTLNTLEPGEGYWMFAAEPETLPGGFSLTVPLPVSLKPGWNEFVYIGAQADVRDALASIEGKYTALFHWTNSGEGGRWAGFHPGLPGWAQGLTSVEPCAAYSILMTEDATLVPLQP